MKTKLLLVLCALASLCSAQVVISTPPRFQSFMQDGTPNAFGCVWTYQTNTTTQLASYTDNTAATVNPNPVPLDAGGSANIWLLAGQIYTLAVKTSGGTNCSSGQTISTTNGMNQSILNLNNTWNGTQTFISPIFLNPSDLQVVFGSPSGTQTILDIPPTSSNFILHGPPITADDTLLSQNATQAVANKNLTSGTQVNGCGMTNGPGTYACIQNNGSAATVLNELAVLTGNPSTATIAPLSISNSGSALGIIGIVVANAGIAGTAVIQQSGLSQCVFGTGTIAGDFIFASAFNRGFCEDDGVNASAYGAFGVVLSSNGGPGLYQVMLFPQIVNGANFGIGIPISVNANTTVNQQLASQVLLGALAPGSIFRATAQITMVPGGGSSNQAIFWSVPTPTIYSALTTSANSSTVNATLQLTCVVVTAGVSGSASCANLVTSSVGTANSAVINVTGTFSAGFGIGNFCSFSVASASNVCTENLLALERLN